MQLEALLTQLGYNNDEAMLEQLKRTLNATDGLEPSSIITLNDHLKPHLCFVALSSSNDRFKIKNVATIPQIRDEVENIITNWAQKHKLQLEKINETTHYIIGKIS